MIPLTLGCRMIVWRYFKRLLMTIKIYIFTGCLLIFVKHLRWSLQFIRPQKLRSMKIKYDKEVDIMYIQFAADEIIESNEDKQGIIIDYNKKGNIVGIEVLNASTKMEHPNSMIYEVAWYSNHGLIISFNYRLSQSNKVIKLHEWFIT